MATADHIRVSAIGQFLAGPWTGEEAQIGISLCLVPGDTWPTGIDDALNPMTINPGGGSEIVADLGRMDYGSTAADGSVFDKSDQIAITQRVKTYISANLNWLSNNFKWTEVRLSAIQATGAVINGATVCTLNPQPAGTDATSDFPPQTAVVQSLTTGGRGPRNRGRIYFPVHGNVAGSGGMVSGTAAGNLNTATKALKDGIATDTDLTMAVVSATHHTASQITLFRVGNHFDTQRRRAQGVPETWTELAA